MVFPPAVKVPVLVCPAPGLIDRTAGPKRVVAGNDDAADRALVQRDRVGGVVQHSPEEGQQVRLWVDPGNIAIEAHFTVLPAHRG